MEKSRKILVSNLPQNVHCDFIELFFENTKKYGGGTVKDVEYDENSATAIVEFETSQAVDRVLQNKNVRMMGQDIRVEAYREKPPSTIEVLGPASLINRHNSELIQLFFENQRSNGGKVEDLTFDSLRPVVFVTFESDKVAMRVTEKNTHVLKGQKLHVNLKKKTKCLPKHAKMSDEIACTVRAKGLKDIPSTDIAEFYFENKRRSGGGKIKAFVLHGTDGDVADITFEDEKDANAVVERSHVINGISIEVSRPIELQERPVYQDRFLVEGLQENTSDDCLVFFFELKTGLKTKSLAYHRDRNDVVLVIMKSALDIAHLKMDCKHETVEGAILCVSEIPVSNCILVRNLPADITKDTIELYFENAKRSKGGPIERVTLIDKTSCLVYFKDFRVISDVLCQSQSLSNNELNVCLYLECLKLTEDEALSNVIPQPVTITTLDTSRMKFITENDKFRQDVEQILLSHCAQVEWPKEGTIEHGVTINCTAHDSVIGSNRLVCRWQNDIKATFEQLMNRIYIHTIRLEDEHSYVDSSVECTTENGEYVMVLMDKDTSTVTLVGASTKLDTAVRSVYGTSGDADDEFKEEKYPLAHEIEVDMLESMNFEDRIHELVPDMVIKVTRQDLTVAFEGRPFDIRTAKLLMFEIKKEFVTAFTDYLSPVEIELYCKTKTADFVNAKLKSSDLHCFWRMTDQKLIICCQKQYDLGRCINVIKSSVVDTVIHLRENETEACNLDILKARLVEWQQMYQDKVATSLEENYRIHLCSTLHLCSTEDISLRLLADVMETIQKLTELKQARLKDEAACSSEEYISGDTVMSVTMKCERVQVRFLKMHRTELIQEVENISGRFKVTLSFQVDNVVISGSRNGIAGTMKKFVEVFESLKCEKHCIYKAAFRDVLMGMNGQGLIAETERKTRCIILLPEESVVGATSATVEGGVLESSIGFSKPLLLQDPSGKECVVDEEEKGSTEIIPFVELQIYSDSKANIDRCRKELCAKFSTTYTTKKVETYKRITSHKKVQDNEKVSKMEDYYIYFKGINPGTSKENLANFVEVTTHGEVDWKKIIFDYSKTCALVTVLLNQNPDMHSVEERIRRRGIDSKKPEVYEVPSPGSIAVSCEEDIGNTESLGLYFERRRVGGAEIKQDPYESEDGTCFVVEYGDPEVVKRVCANQTPHILANKQLRVSPYFECQAGSIWDSELHVLKIPEPAVMRFQPNYFLILQRKCCKELLSDLQQNHCNPIFTEEGLRLECTLTLKPTGFKHLAEDWEESSRRIVDNYVAENITERQLQSSEKIWRELMEFFKSEHIQIRDDVVTTLDNSSFVILLTGFSDPVKDILSKLSRKQAKIEKRLNSKTETVWVDSLKLRLLDAIGFCQDLKREIEDIEVYIGDGEVTIEGQLEDISLVRVKLYDVDNQISVTKWCHGFSNDCVDFVGRKLLDKISSLLKSKHLTAVWKIDMRDIEVCAFEGLGASVSGENDYEVFDKDPYSSPDDRSVGKNAKELLKSAITEIQETVQDSIIEVLTSLEWISFLENMSDTYKEDAEIKFKDSLEKIFIYGMKKEADLIHKRLKGFLDENAIRSETIQSGKINVRFIKMLRKDFVERLEKKFELQEVKILLQDDCVNIRGKKKGIAEAKKEFKLFFDAIQCEKYTIQKMAVKDVFRDEKEQGAIAIVEKETSCLIKLSGDNAIFVKQASIDSESEDSDGGYEVPISARGATGTSQAFAKYTKKAIAAVNGKEEGTISKQDMQKILQETSSMEIHIYSDSKTNIEKCKKELDAKLERLYTKKKIEYYKEIVKSLKQEEMQELDIIALANINIDPQSGVITIEGPTKQVSDVTHELQMKLLKLERKRHDIKSPEELFKLVQWQYEEVTMTEFKLIPYNKTLNQKIEHAYKANKSAFEFEDDNGDEFVIDFKQLIEYRKYDDQDRLRVLRKDILKSAVSTLPEEWTAMKDNENIRIVPIPNTDQTYQDISNRFLTDVKTGLYAHRRNFNPNNLRVNKIERIQNKTLYQQYQAKKKQMIEQKPNLPPNMPIERELWHGTKFDAVTSIQLHGFNRCYSGNPNGQICQGKKGMRYLPAVDAKDPTILYDCAVDNLQNPMEFVIFNDTQAYPAYIITFTT